MKGKRWVPVLVLLLLAAVLPLTAFAQEGYAENRYYYRQLDADERAVYDALASLSAPRTMDPVTVRVHMPESTTRYSSTDFINAAEYAFVYDNPAAGDWIGFIREKQPNGEDIPFEQLRVGTPDHLSDYDSIILEIRPSFTASDLRLRDQYLEGMIDGDVPGMSRYERASYILDRVTARLRYDYERRYETGLMSSPMCITTGYATCEGFSKVYKILADKLSLPCVLSGGSGHMCVQVQMEDGGWYLVEPQGGLLAAGRRTVAGDSAYWPQSGPAHWLAREGHGAIVMPPIPENDYRARKGSSVPVGHVRPRAGV